MTRIRFSSVKTEGGLLPQDLLSRIQGGDAQLPGMAPETYHLAPHERIGEAVNRAWTRLTAAWKSFQQALSQRPENDLATGLTRDRWLLPLFQELGYGRLTRVRTALPDAATKSVDGYLLEGRTYAISHDWHHSPIHLLGCRIDLDRRQKGVAGAASSSPHGLVQDFLNRSDEHLWGFLSNGHVLRILRDHHSLTRQAYVEFDLQAIMEGEQYSEFLLLWMVCHQSRVEHDQPEQCVLETWLQTSREQGIRALDKLRLGVEQAIQTLGTGFLEHPDNARLKQALSTGDLNKQDYYRELLRLVYRLIFLFVAEEREALLDPKASEESQDRFRRFYSTRRIREMAERKRGGTHSDLWQGLALIMRSLDQGEPALALPALGSALWSQGACAWLMDAQCDNHHLLHAFRQLGHISEGKTRYTVNWRNVGADELGSIYESLLELHPRLNWEAGQFELDTAAGHERKTTGSYYTPTSLVDCLLDSALEPVLRDATAQADPEQAILNVKVCDPACGSGHFLVAAARRMAKALAAVRSGEDEPSPVAVQGALRDVVGRCVFGVDINPMAVELCKVSLWMEALEPGKPLSFLDSHIRTGNALLGATPALLHRGIPNDAFKPLEGDDKARVTRLKRHNKDEREGQTTLLFEYSGSKEDDLNNVVSQAMQVEHIPDHDVAQLKKKARTWDRLAHSPAYRDAWFRADAWCAAFVWPKTSDELETAAITHDTWLRIQEDVTTASPLTRKTVRELAQTHQFFHWHLAFPQVFGPPKAEIDDTDTTGWTQGFDVVLGNPPWERIKLQEKEFFANRDPAVANAPNAAARRRLIAKLPESDPPLWQAWCQARREAEGQSHFVRLSGRYPLCGKGDINTYAVFAEHNRVILDKKGRAGFIVPPGLATDDTTKAYFQELVAENSLASLLEFENEEFLFPGVDHRVRFILITVTGDAGIQGKADLAFRIRRIEMLRDPDRHFSLSPGDFALLNPNTRTCPTFRSRHDAELNLAIYRRAGVLWHETEDQSNPWDIRFMAMLHMANDSGSFRTQAEMQDAGQILTGNRFDGSLGPHVPLIEAKMVHHFDHRFGTYENQSEAQANQGKLPELDDQAHANPTQTILPRYWVAETDVNAKLQDRWSRPWLLGWRDICRATDARTVIASLIPRVAVGHTTPLFLSTQSAMSLCAFYANLCSFALDYAARQKVGGTHLTYGYLKQLPVLPPSTYEAPTPWDPERALRDWILPRVLELSYTAWDLEGFAADCGYHGPPFRWDEARRFHLRCELDALFFHLYLPSDEAGQWKPARKSNGAVRDETEAELATLKSHFPTPRHAVDHIMDTFPIIKNKDEKTHNHYRTKQTILKIFDAMQNAKATGNPYQIQLNPPPAHPSRAHPESTRPVWNKRNDGPPVVI